MLASVFILVASVAVISAQTIPSVLFKGFHKWAGVAKNTEECMFYAFDVQRLQSGYGYMFYNPYPCSPPGGNKPGNNEVPNLVGCTGSLDFNFYLNYYLTASNANSNVNIMNYFNSVRTAFQTYGSPANFNHHYQVKNCMFCKLLDSYATNLDPFCPQEICVKYGLSLSRCLSDNPTGDVAGIGMTAIAPNMATTWDVDTPYDILFSVYGVSNSAPYVGMPLGTSSEGCPSGGATRGLDGIPTGFTFQPNYQWLKDNLAKTWIYLLDGRVVHPECALINPNGGPTERVVVYCGRDLGTESNPPIAIAIDGPVQMSNGEYTTGVDRMSVKIGTLNQGSLMVSAERYTKSDPNWNSFFVSHPSLHKDPCPSETKQIIMTSWTKGLRQTHPSLVAFPAGLRWAGANQLGGVKVGLQDGRILQNNPYMMTIHDDDDDGFLHVCLNTIVKAVNVTFNQGLFFDPRNTMNVKQFARVTGPISMYEPYPNVNPNAIATPAPEIVTGIA
jgi:hypothetical protein